MPPVERVRAALGVLAAAAVPLAGCSAEAPLSRGERAPLTIAENVLSAIASARGLPRDQALELAVEDGLLARQLETTEPTLARWVERVVFARQMMEALVEEAKAAGPPSEAEVAQITEARFWELDRPRMVRVVHAVVLSSQEDPKASALADRIARATDGARSPEEFQARAKAVPPENFKVKVELLPPVAEDGRAVDPERPPPAGPAVQHFDGSFAAAAQRLQRPGQQSPVLRTPYGYHVIYLIAVLEPHQPALDERRALLHDEIMKARAKTLSTALLDRERRELAPQQERSALGSIQALGAPR